LPLSEEHEFLDCYLKIEETRFQDRINVIFDIDSEALAARVPHLLLQPLVENALLHGMARKVADGEIRVLAKKIGDRLRISVEDNGPGFGEAPPLGTNGTPLGLKITRERLLNLYGTNQQFRIETSPFLGTHVNIEIPFILERALTGTVSSP
jgi:LytS/YehU family sensor histidine kinase